MRLRKFHTKRIFLLLEIFLNRAYEKSVTTPKTKDNREGSHGNGLQKNKCGNLPYVLYVIIIWVFSLLSFFLSFLTPFLLLSFFLPSFLHLLFEQTGPLVQAGLNYLCS